MRVLIFGLGSIGKRHLQIIKNTYADFTIYAYRETNNNYIEGVENVYSLEEAFSYKPNIVFITNPTSLHIETALIAAKNGCHIFMEKPLSNNLDNIEELLRVIKEKELITLMGCNMRFNSILLKLKECVDNSVLGKVISFNINCGSYLPDWRPTQDYSKSYSASRDLGGGVVLDLIHEIDYAIWIFGDFLEITSSVAKLSNLNINTEDHADIIVKTSKNVIGSIHLDYYRITPKRQIEVIFENGVIVADLIDNKMNFITKSMDKVVKFSEERNKMYEEQIKYFFQSINDKKSTFNGIEEGYEVLKVALKVKGV